MIPGCLWEAEVFATFLDICLQGGLTPSAAPLLSLSDTSQQNGGLKIAPATFSSAYVSM